MAVDLEAQTPVQDVVLDGNPAQSEEKSTDTPPRQPRPSRPNFNKIHAQTVPLNVYPLPVFIPHNPLSIVHIAIKLISHSLSPPTSHKIVHKVYISPETQSIHVTDAASIRALWEQGFWGKGSLSRSEPQWLAGEKKRRGVAENKTAAEITLSRREERKQFKLERARAQREAIEQQLRQEGKLDADGSTQELVEGQVTGRLTGDEGTVDGDVTALEASKSVVQHLSLVEEDDAGPEEEEEVQIFDQEHFQLTPEEAFYLTYSLGALSVVSDPSTAIDAYPTWYLVRLFTLHATTPVSESVVQQLQSALSTVSLSTNVPSIAPDNPFILRYVVYHHFRSLGWVVRPGIKFAVDYLLYLRGPAFQHAEFAIMIVPSYSDVHWTSAPSDESRKAELAKKDWWWLHRVNRVQSAVFKTLVLVYVEVPKPWDNGKKEVDIGSVLKQYTVREIVVKRWSPNRNRD